MPGPTSADVRRQFIEFFVDKHGHAFVPSSPVVPHNDPTLLFANAGMNQFKPIFLGEEPNTFYGPPRAANSQKCIRAGGKHNDLDDVGRDTYHHTFFEMLGNWSFGDYFKAEAVAWAWELLTHVWGLDPTRLHATYFQGDPAEGLEPDEEAKTLWLNFLQADRVHPGNKKDNFWEMGDVGPCGPCSEIHYDRTPDKTGGLLVNGDSDRVIEIWNLVFIQYNRTPAGLRPLPHRHVDTGMGFERITAVLQGKDSNYDTDVFRPILDRLSQVSGVAYDPALDAPPGVAFRAIADHVRMATFAIADGARPGPNKADSVLRSVIRRASRYGYTTLGLREPFLHKLVGTVADHMGEAFPEVLERAGDIEGVVAREEGDFLKVIDRGLGLYADAASRARSAGGRFAGSDVFELHTTFGFPPDMTMQLARDDGFTPDTDDYHARFRAFQDASRGSVSGTAVVDFGDIPATDDAGKYDCRNDTGRVLALVVDGQVTTDGAIQSGQEAGVVLDATCFYAEQGGQVGDTGVLRSDTASFEVLDTKRNGNRVVHVGRLTDGTLRTGDAVETHVNNRRDAVRRHHTATHLLNLALVQVLGGHVQQRGSLVDDARLRFDFSHDKAVSADELERVERLVNASIRANMPVRADLVPLAEAKTLAGVRAVFGEKYPDPVRVVYASPLPLEESDGAVHSIEFCGGTHTDRTGDIGLLKVLSEESVSKGVRRITAVAGEAALHAVQVADRRLREAAGALSTTPELFADRARQIRDEVKKLKKHGTNPGRQGPAAVDAETLLASAEDVAGVAVIIGAVDDVSDDGLRSLVDAVKARGQGVAVLLASAGDDKVSFVAGVADNVIPRGLKAGDWVREAAKVCGGGGGGRPNLAQAGGKDASKLADALEAARSFAAARLAV